MDFWIEIGFTALFGLLRDRKNIAKWHRALAKAHFLLTHLVMTDPKFKAAYEAYVKERGGE